MTGNCEVSIRKCCDVCPAKGSWVQCQDQYKEGLLSSGKLTPAAAVAAVIAATAAAMIFTFYDLCVHPGIPDMEK